MNATIAASSFTAPGPGVWARDADHQSAPRGLLLQDLFAESFTEGSRTCFARYGLPLDRLEGRHVHGWFYFRAVPAGAPDKGGAPPPPFVLKVVARIHPELRRRRAAATETLSTRRWLTDARNWADERPEWVERITKLLEVELDELDDEQLARHVTASMSVASDMARRHFELLGPAAAVGRLIVEARRAGVSSDHVLAALRGSSPASAASRAPLRELARIVETSGTLPLTVDALAALSPRAGELVRVYLHEFGWRPLADDIEAPCLAERPDRLIDLVAAQMGEQARPVSPAGAHALLDAAPEPRRPAMSTLLEDAREAYACLDDNSGVTAWAMGALRRASLEAGRRAARDGALADASDVFDLTPAELATVAARRAGVDHVAISARRTARRSVTEAPETLGGAPIAPPDPRVFPQPIAELAEAFGAYLELKFTNAGAPTSGVGSVRVDDRVVCSGTIATPGRVTGRLLVASDPTTALDRIEPGDILVCPYTSAAWNALFPMLGGVVTRFGGPLGHAAVMAREFAIPALVGVGEISEGIDGAVGEVIAH